jgi:hypothetical protein
MPNIGDIYICKVDVTARQSRLPYDLKQGQAFVYHIYTKNDPCPHCLLTFAKASFRIEELNWKDCCILSASELKIWFKKVKNTELFKALYE